MVLFPWQDDSKQASYAPDQLDLFPTSLCGVLVFDSVSRRLLLRLRLLRRPSVSLTQLCHTPSFTHHLSHTISLTQLCHTHNLAGVALWHSATSTCVWRGRCGACCPWLALVARLVAVGRPGRRATLRGRRVTWWHPPSFHVAGVVLAARGWLWWRAWSPLVARGAAPLFVAGVALSDIHLRFTWQAWYLATSTCVLRGTRGTCCTWLALVARLVAVGRPGRRATLRGRRVTSWHPPSFYVAGVALGDIYLPCAWHTWHLLHLAGSGGALGRRWSPGAPRHFAWQALYQSLACLMVVSGKISV